MKEKPRHAKSLFSGSVPFLIFNGVVIGLLTLIAFIAGAKFYTGDTHLFPLFPEQIDEDALLHAQTMAFVVLSFSQLVHSFNLRSRTKSIFSIGIFTNKYLVFSFLSVFLCKFVSSPFRPCKYIRCACINDARLGICSLIKYHSACCE